MTTYCERILKTKLRAVLAACWLSLVNDVSLQPYMDVRAECQSVRRFETVCKTARSITATALLASALAAVLLVSGCGGSSVSGVVDPIAKAASVSSSA